jgi:YesN/AraC family two-component response regulator
MRPNISILGTRISGYDGEQMTAESDCQPNGPSVLIVDDERDMRDPLRDWLIRAGYRAQAAAGGPEALAIAEREPIDVVDTDFVMPGMNGLELLDALRERHPAIQVIFLTGRATKDLAISVLRQGRSFDLLEKPLHNLQRLTHVIDAAWAARHPGPAPSAAGIEAVPATLESVIERSPIVRAVFAHVTANLGSALALATVADAVGYNPAYLTDLIRRETGQPLGRWIIELRLRRAQRLLLETPTPIHEIAAAVGYPDRSHFARTFRQHVGETPQLWRQRELQRLDASPR